MSTDRMEMLQNISAIQDESLKVSMETIKATELYETLYVRFQNAVEKVNGSVLSENMGEYVKSINQNIETSNFQIESLDEEISGKFELLLASSTTKGSNLLERTDLSTEVLRLQHTKLNVTQSICKQLEDICTQLELEAEKEGISEEAQQQRSLEEEELSIEEQQLEEEIDKKLKTTERIVARDPKRQTPRKQPTVNRQPSHMQKLSIFDRFSTMRGLEHIQAYERNTFLEVKEKEEIEIERQVEYAR